MSRELRLCPGVGGRKCGAFLSSLDRDPHPTCTRCRGKVCTRDLTCDFCAKWSSTQWEAFAKKRSYAQRKHSRPSGSLPPAPKTSPCAWTSSEVKHPEASSSSLPSGGQAKRGGGLGMHLVLRPVRLPLLPLDLGPARGVEVSLVVRLVRASSLLSPLLLWELGRWELLVRSRRPLPMLLPRLPLPAHHCTLCDVVSRESLRRSASVRDLPVFPDLRIEEQGRIVEPALGRAALVAGLGDLALAPLSARGQAVKSVVGKTRIGRCPLASGCGLLTAIGRVAFALARCLGETGRSPRTAIGRVAFALACCLGETGRGPRTATGLAGIALGVTGRDLLLATGLGGSVRDPLLVGEVARDPPRAVTGDVASLL